ncbi:hypothetical protein, partial [Sphingomonas bacterium]|uniref:hypothetical protein n=1 Tax=Sphingomonas bacterium TaxID=1895847 RepID=UPI001C2D7F62
MATLLWTGGPVSAQTRAGATVSNVAQASATVGGTTTSAASNPVSFVVAERLDVALARRGQAAVPPAGAPLALPALLTN